LVRLRLRRDGGTIADGREEVQTFSGRIVRAIDPVRARAANTLAASEVNA
jgi:hypothetical protein